MYFPLTILWFRFIYLFNGWGKYTTTTKAYDRPARKLAKHFIHMKCEKSLVWISHFLTAIKRKHSQKIDPIEIRTRTRYLRYKNDNPIEPRFADFSWGKEIHFPMLYRLHIPISLLAVTYLTAFQLKFSAI